MLHQAQFSSFWLPSDPPTDAKAMVSTTQHDKFQPMFCGKTNIKAADPPTNLEPNIPAISQLSRPYERTEQDPRGQQNHSAFQEHSLGLSKLL